MASADNPKHDFFISRAGADAEVAIWIDTELKALGFTTLIQDVDFAPGQSIPGNIERGTATGRMIALLSPDYFKSPHTTAEWQTGYMRDPDGSKAVLVPIRVRDCEIPPLLGRLGYIDFVGRSEEDRRYSLGRLRDRPAAQKQVSVAKLPVVSPILLGRETELLKLNEAWISPDIRVISLVAFGGVGKSALAVNWWHRNQAPGAARVLGWSFYSQGAGEDSQASADPFLDHALRVWFKVENPPNDSWARGEMLAELIRQDPTLLILDGLEPIQHAPGPMHGRLKDPGMAALLRELAAHNPGLCVCTSRLPLTDLEDFAGTGAEQIDLDNLAPVAGVALLAQLKVQGTEDELRDSSEEFGNHALALTLLGHYLVAACDGDIRKRDTIPTLFDEPGKGGHARRIMRQYEGLFKDRPELAILRILGLFDRPADPGAVGVLRKLPFFALGETEWKFSLTDLQKLRLLDKPGTNGPLDCHPLIREHFGDELRRSHADVFRRAHSKLYGHYAKQAPQLPNSLVEMTPLFYAVYHGCQAGRHQEALEKVYRDRLRRGRDAFLFNSLGAFGVNLSLLANFFEFPWAKAVAGLTPAAQSWVINEAASSLRALGRLDEAVEPTKLGAVTDLQRMDLENAAASLSNLSDLHLTLGAVSDALESARKSVELADRSHDAGEQLLARTTLAHALHNAGEIAQAMELFSRAEKMQVELEPEFRTLYAWQGYQYCDLLLGQGQLAEVRQRATQSFSWAEHNGSLLSKAGAHLSLGRSHPLSSPEAATHFDEAVRGLRLAGTLNNLPFGLLARAANFRHLSDFTHAQKDLDEVRVLATRCGMRLHLTDYHLEQARLFLAQSQPDRARPHVAAAAKLIAETGYHRRDAELRQLELETATN